MRKIFLIVDYSETVEKQLRLVKLIKSIKENGYDVFLASHIKLPDIIVNDVDYYFYDKNNELLYDYDLKEPNYFFGDSFTVKYMPLFNISTHYIAIMRLLLPSLSMIKNMGYGVVHKIEYDNIIENYDFIKQLDKKIVNYDVIGGVEIGQHKNNMENTNWIHGCYYVINLKNFKIDDFYFDREEIIKIFRNKYNDYSEYSGERTSYEILYKDKKILKLSMEDMKKNIQLNLNTKNDKRLNIENRVTLFKEGKNLKFFIDNTKNNKKNNVKFILNSNSIYNVDVNPNTWYINTLKKYEEVKLLEINVNNQFYKKIDFNNQNDLNLIKNNVRK